MGAIINHAAVLNKVLCAVEDVGPLPRGEYVYCFHVGEEYFWVQTQRDILGVREFRLHKRLLQFFRVR